MIRALLERWGLVHPRAVAKPARAKRKAAVRRKPVMPAAPVVPKARKPAMNHAAAVKVDLLNAVADALGRAPAELDPMSPKATIAVNGSLYIIQNTVAALSEFQTRLEKLSTTVRSPGVSRNALASGASVMAKQRSHEADREAYLQSKRQQPATIEKDT